MIKLDEKDYQKFKAYQEWLEANEGEDIENLNGVLLQSSLQEYYEAYKPFINFEIPMDLNNEAHQHLLGLSLCAKRGKGAWSQLANVDQIALLELVAAHYDIENREAHIEQALLQSIANVAYVGSIIPNPYGAAVSTIGGLLLDRLANDIKFHDGIPSEILEALNPQIFTAENISHMLELPLTFKANAFLQQKINQIAQEKINKLKAENRNVTADIQYLKTQQKSFLTRLSNNLKIQDNFIVKNKTLNQVQQQRIEQTLNRYGVKLECNKDEVLKQLAPIVNYIEQQNEKVKQAIRLEDNVTAFRGINSALGVMGQIGQQFDLPQLQQMAVLGQSSLNLVMNIGKLQGAFGFGAVSGWAALEPYSAIAMAGLTIFGSFFGRAKQNNGMDKALQAIMHQIQALHMEMRASFNQVFENQKRIYEAVLKGLDYLTFLMKDLKNIDNKLNRMETIIHNAAKDIHTFRLIELYSALTKDLSGEFPMKEEQRNGTLLQLSNWLDEHLKVSIQTTLLRNTDNITKANELLSDPHFDVTTMFPFFVSQLQRVCPPIAELAADMNLVNIPLYTLTSNTFMKAAICYRLKENNYLPLIERIQKTLIDVRNIIDCIQNDATVIDSLLRQYREIRYQLGRTLAKIIPDIPETVSKKQTLNELLVQLKAPDKEYLIKVLEDLEYRRLLLKHICQLLAKPVDLADKIEKLDSKYSILNTAKEIFDNANQLILISSQEHQYENFEKALLNGADLNCWDNWGQPIHNLSITYNRSNQTIRPHYLSKMLHLLFKSAKDLQYNNGSRYDWPPTWGQNVLPIQMVGNNGQFEAVLLYCASGYDIQESKAYLYNAYWWANLNCWPAIVQKYLVKDMLNSRGMLNKTDLRKAYFFYQTIEAGLSFNVDSISSECVLWLVAVLGDINVLEALGDSLKTVDVNKVIPVCRFSPLMMAVHCGHLPVVDRLLNLGASITASFETVEPNPREIDSNSCGGDSQLKQPSHLLFLAINRQHWQIANKLIQAGIKPTREQNELITKELAKGCENFKDSKPSVLKSTCEVRSLIEESIIWLNWLKEIQLNIVYPKISFTREKAQDMLNSDNNNEERKFPATHLFIHNINGLEYHEVPGDGHCLYHAVGLYLNKDQRDLRKIVANYLEENLKKPEIINIITALLPERKTIKDYIDDVRNEIEWADDLELTILMMKFNRPIVVIDIEGKIRNLSNIDQYKTDPIFVYYNGHDHYDALLLTGENEAKEILNKLLEREANFEKIDRSGYEDTLSFQQLIAQGRIQSLDNTLIRIIFDDLKMAKSFNLALVGFGFSNRQDADQAKKIIPLNLKTCEECYAVDLTPDEYHLLQNNIKAYQAISSQADQPSSDFNKRTRPEKVAVSTQSYVNHSVNNHNFHNIYTFFHNANGFYGQFKRAYRESNQNCSNELIGLLQQTKDAYKLVVRKTELDEEMRIKAEVRLKKLKEPDKYFRFSKNSLPNS